ncbi:16S rRNA (adenine(1518)-N(6)/adenine(1519)-N(6))-dimethyltransferase RsmA [Acidocella aminolytica]|jgi:16S rRNA (adenine1518-N6/adenine1519-N6)-dimethyltransferase|uniref:Ribosomal RNA small subunit methyltransferase A n=1 Tax=Acidocella aminolytica 101 = DSM 11237 TaxID=1120923 RepID=A0A0D6PGU9_9PROT|nr:16S rRNA (adenine(1518)-N(6)/adenine(1519)-N(6))-dimethyltransferase RsmA [Acidocella aminolytica]GAN80064.1 dimethyladenosine transferase/16S rRNA methyltransferase [Acidocella aminolytica 101 = DSM 11237]GBQ40673.1 dimethyladenosine transferase [Acidocella aminolytica 101 = DSM 11237]SHF07537.1 dimethyladenosine transferase [Acidocella aminolytica 101 = DSM 11237]
MAEISLPSLAETIRIFDLRADKSLGQHFLLDPSLLARIAAAAGNLAGLNVIEIGPGPGGLTRALLETKAVSVTAIEFDKRAVAAITALAATTDRLHIIEADAMKADLPALVPAPRVVVANLPYNIGTLLLVNWLQQAAEFQSLTLMFQLEVADRVCAMPNSRTYGRVSVLAQWLCDVSMLMRIPAGAFAPPPKVESALIRLVPRPHQPTREELKAMERLTAAAFGQRRKMLRGALKPLGGEALCAEAGIDASRRAETLSVEEFVALMRALMARDS